MAISQHFGNIAARDGDQAGIDNAVGSSGSSLRRFDR
jgi:hypothetical protein